MRCIWYRRIQIVQGSVSNDGIGFNEYKSKKLDRVENVERTESGENVKFHEVELAE